MTTEDYRVAAACPTDPGTVFDFVGRPPYPDSRSNMSIRYSEGWEAQVCNGVLAYELPAEAGEGERPVQAVATVTEESGPVIIATATTDDLPATETPASRSSLTSASDGEQSTPLPLDQPTPSPTTAPTDAVTITPTPTPTPIVSPTDTPTPEPTPVTARTTPPTQTVAPLLTVVPQPTTAPLATVVSLPTITLVPSATPSPTVTPVPTATLPPTVAPSPTPIPPPPLRHLEEKQFMLKLINDERVSAGLNPVVLGDNAAAQLHAEASLENCFSSHWGVDGLKPYMRYSLAGGYQSNGENGSGRSYCIKASDGYRANGTAQQQIREAMDGLMNSSGHRDNILDPWHKKINIGLAWDRYNFQIYQHFEGDYVDYTQPPIIDKGVLSMSGSVKNGVHFKEDFDLGIQVYYDPPPRSLTPGQVARTYCYDNGLQVAAPRPPLTGNSYYPRQEFSQTNNPCPNPYDVSANARAARSHDEALSFSRSAYLESLGRQPETITVPWITALEWTARSEEFSVTVDLTDVLAEHGDGVYSLIVWGSIGGEDVVISQYSIFHGVTPPDTYDFESSEGG